jgi:hypothetical protein
VKNGRERERERERERDRDSWREVDSICFTRRCNCTNLLKISHRTNQSVRDKKFRFCFLMCGFGHIVRYSAHYYEIHREAAGLKQTPYLRSGL